MYHWRLQFFALPEAASLHVAVPTMQLCGFVTQDPSLLIQDILQRVPAFAWERDLRTDHVVWSIGFDRLLRSANAAAHVAFPDFLTRLGVPEEDRAILSRRRRPDDQTFRVLSRDGTVHRFRGREYEIAAGARAVAIYAKYYARGDEHLIDVFTHDVRNAATVVSGGLHILRTRPDRFSAEEKAELLNDMLTEWQRLERTLETLLSVARLEGGFDAQREPVRIREVVESEIERFSVIDPTLVIRTLWDGRSFVASIDATFFRQAMRMLLSHGQLHTPAGAPLLVAGAEGNQAISITVADRGGSIPQQELERIFDPFYQSSRSLHLASEGALCLSRRLTEAQGGRMEARATGDGVAVTAWFPSVS